MSRIASIIAQATTYLNLTPVARRPRSSRSTSGAIEVPPRRRVITAGQLRKLLQVLTDFDFKPGRVEVSPEGALTLHSEQEAAATQPDALSEWEARRGTRPQ